MTATVACADKRPDRRLRSPRKRWTVAEVEALFALVFNNILFRRPTGNRQHF